MTQAQQRSAAKRFAADWADKGYEKGHSQPFWLSLLRDVYGVEHPEQFIFFEDQIVLDHTSFIDGFIPTTHVLIDHCFIFQGQFCHFCSIHRDREVEDNLPNPVAIRLLFRE